MILHLFFSNQLSFLNVVIDGALAFKDSKYTPELSTVYRQYFPYV